MWHICEALVYQPLVEENLGSHSEHRSMTLNVDGLSIKSALLRCWCWNQVQIPDEACPARHTVWISNCSAVSINAHTSTWHRPARRRHRVD